jgi:5S rRNA maturation endonuclease (ribonuclease M5)
MTGQFEFIRTVPDPNGVLTPTKTNGTVNQLHGMLGHIDFVDCHNEKMEAKRDSGSPRAKDAAKAVLRSKQRLYRRFLLFKDFYLAQRPIVVCEGKTDNVYLLYAIKSLVAAYPKLASLSANNKAKVNIRILRTLDSSAGRILNLGQGWSGLNGLIERYLSELYKFKAPGMDHAVILLVDNDSGADEIYKTIKRLTKKNALRTASFVHVTGNLYVVVTPLKEGVKQSEIEDCFDDAIKNLNLGGRIFSPDNKADPNIYFGKSVLAQYVRENAPKIDFSGFAGVLDRITAAIEDYEAKRAKPAAVAGAAVTN